MHSKNVNHRHEFNLCRAFDSHQLVVLLMAYEAG